MWRWGGSKSVLNALRRFPPQGKPFALPVLWARGLSSQPNQGGYQKPTAPARPAHHFIYPPNPSTSVTLTEFRSKYNALTDGESSADSVESLCGRVISKRESGSKLVFYTVEAGGERLQLFCSQKNSDGDMDFREQHQGVKRGDVVWATGFAGRTKRGELSLYSSSLQVLAPCIPDLPEPNALQDPNTRFRNRHIDLLSTPSRRDTFRKRADIIRFIREYLNDMDFLEVETPTLVAIAGGAAAQPFKTRSHALDRGLTLRIATELPLKRLVVGGFDRVYEIGKQFRNEGVDATHNPEFTTCEFYAAYMDYQQLMTMTEDMIRCLVERVNGSQVVTYETTGGEEISIDFGKPWRRISIVEELERKFGEKLPDVNDPCSIPKLMKLAEAHNISCPAPHTLGRVLDAMISDVLEPMCQQPTFLCDHPEVISPLARSHRDKPGLTERFELFVAGNEICNAYSELNAPEVQRARFQDQQRERQGGDNDAAPPDEDYCLALEYGLPPTGGWGLGVDRLCMLLTNKKSIREVLLFPMLKEA